MFEHRQLRTQKINSGKGIFAYITFLTCCWTTSAPLQSGPATNGQNNAYSKATRQRRLSVRYRGWDSVRWPGLLLLKVQQHAVLLWVRFILRINCAIRFCAAYSHGCYFYPQFLPLPLKKHTFTSESNQKDLWAQRQTPFRSASTGPKNRSCHFSKSINHHKPTSRADSGSSRELSAFNRTRPTRSSQRKVKSGSDLSFGLSFPDRNSQQVVIRWLEKTDTWTTEHTD